MFERLNEVMFNCPAKLDMEGAIFNPTGITYRTKVKNSITKANATPPKINPLNKVNLPTSKKLTDQTKLNTTTKTETKIKNDRGNKLKNAKQTIPTKPADPKDKNKRKRPL